MRTPLQSLQYQLIFRGRMSKPNWKKLEDGKEVYLKGHDFALMVREDQAGRVLEIAITVRRAERIFPLELTNKLNLSKDCQFQMLRLRAVGERPGRPITEIREYDVVYVDENDANRLVE